MLCDLLLAVELSLKVLIALAAFLRCLRYACGKRRW